MRGSRVLLLSFLLGAAALVPPAHAGQPAHDDDVVVTTGPSLASPYAIDLATSDGAAVFAAVQVDDATNGPGVRVYSSPDRGLHWSQVHVFADADGDPATGYSDPALYFMSGANPTLHVVMRHDAVLFGTPISTIELQKASYGEPFLGSFTGFTVIAATDVTYRHPDIAGDDVTGGAKLFVTCEGLDGTGTDVWVIRSLDNGSTWQAGYKIAEVTSILGGNERYPRITCGRTGFVHVAWARHPFLGAPHISYRRANGSAASIANWFGTVTAADSAWAPSLGASSDGHVLIAGLSNRFGPGHVFATFSSDGANVQTLAFPNLRGAPDVKALPASRGWITSHHEPGGQVVVATRNLDVNASLAFQDTVSNALYPWTADDRVPVDIASELVQSPAALWLRAGATGADTVFFDATYRAHGGFGERASRTFFTPPKTPPTLANLDDDPALEIVYADTLGQVWARNGDGSALAGWPRSVGPLRPRASIAVGDLDGDGRNEVVAGTAGGGVWAMNRTGAVLPGFPKTVNSLHPCWVSLGDLQGDSRLEIVACAGNQVHVLDAGANEMPGFPAFTTTGFDIPSPAAIGDVDADGSRDLVVLSDMNIRWLRADGTLGSIRNVGGSALRSPVALADVDGNGDLEALFRSDGGLVFLTDHTAFANRAGWPVTGAASASNAGAIFGRFTSGDTHAVAWADTTLHVRTNAGVQPATFTPRPGAPASSCGLVAGDLDGGYTVPAVLAFGDDDPFMQVFTSAGGPEWGWPTYVGYGTDYDAGIGDVDGDGWPELVQLHRGGMIVWDMVGATTMPTSPGSWPMYGYDAAHSFCYECETSHTTDAPAGTAAARLRLAAPSPNPSRGATTLAFELPRSGEVALDVYDLAGRHVRSLASGAHAAGAHRATWDGRDASGAASRPGVYLVRLALAGAGDVRAKLVRVE